MRAYVDGDCPLCCTLGRLVPSVPYQVELPPGVSRKEAEEALHLWDGNRLYKGFDALVRLGSAHPFFWPFYPLLRLLGWMGLGERVYRALALRRPKRKGRG